jgi:hypothetical protein
MGKGKSMKTINEVIQNKISGLRYGNRIILPFHAQFLKVIINDDIITDFSPSNKGIHIVETTDRTDIYFLEHKHLKDTISKYEAIKMVVVEKDKEIFNLDNHLKLALYLEKEHHVKIEKTDADILFIE